MRKEGLEPPYPFGYQILSLARLPVPPLSRPAQTTTHLRFHGPGSMFRVGSRFASSEHNTEHGTWTLALDCGWQSLVLPSPAFSNGRSAARVVLRPVRARAWFAGSTPHLLRNGAADDSRSEHRPSDEDCRDRAQRSERVPLLRSARIGRVRVVCGGSPPRVCVPALPETCLDYGDVSQSLGDGEREAVIGRIEMVAATRSTTRG